MRLGTSVIAHPSAHVSLVQRATPEPIRRHFRSWLLRILCGDRDAQARSWLLHAPEQLDRAPEILAGALAEHPHRRRRCAREPGRTRLALVPTDTPAVS